MNPKVKDALNDTIEVVSEETGVLAKASTEQVDEQWQSIVKQVSEILADLPTYISNFLSSYNRPIVAVSLIIAAIVTLKVLLAIVDTINSIPLLSPLFELIGMGYSAWFAYRYLLTASTRKEFAEAFDSLKQQVLG